MSFQKKYYFTFYSSTGENNLVEIWQDTTQTISAEEVEGMYNPFSVEMPSLKGKFDAVRGTGCEINLNCKSNMKFFNGLYHVNPKEFKILHYIDGNINWIGYMNSELFRETYSDISDYSVQFTGNDGFALMDRFHFIQDGAIAYSGIKSQIELLQIIFGKIGLPFEELKVCISTTFTGQSNDSTKTIFHETYIDTANYYNEDGEPETLRTVLESILLPYGAFITQSKGSLIITDNHNLASNSSFTFKRFKVSDWTYNGTEAVNNRKELSSVGYAGTGQEIEVSGGKNKQVVSYSPYPFELLADKSLIDLSEFNAVDVNWSSKDGYYFKNLYSNKYWSGLYEITKMYFDEIKIYANYQSFPAVGAENITYKATDTGYVYRWNNYTYVRFDSNITYGGAENVHLRIPYNATNTLSAKFIPTPYITLPKSEFVGTGSTIKIVAGAGLMIKGKIGIVTKNITYQGHEVDTNIFNLYITTRVKIGENYFNGVNWTTTPSFFKFRVSKPDNTRMNTKINIYTNKIEYDVEMNTIGNKGVDGVFIPVDKDLSGVFEIEFWTDLMADNVNPVTHEFYYVTNENFTGVKELWINNISTDIVLEDGTKIPDSDIEYIGYLDSNFKDEAEKVVLIAGTESSISDRGKLMYSDGVFHPIKQWTRWNQTYKIEELLLGSLTSNNKAGYYTLNNVTLNNSFLPFNVLNDSAFLPDRNFMVGGYNINFEENIINTDLIEISADTLIINK